MGYTRRKIRGINLSFLLAGFIFACWAMVCAWSGWPRAIRGGSTVGFILFGVASLFFSSFPLIWAKYPEKHPVNHELRRYGKIREVAARLDREIAERVETIGPFRFTASMVIYDSGHEFQMIPYDQIVAAEIPPDDIPAVRVRTRAGREYQWFRTWMQGIFDPAEVLAKIRATARLDDEGPAINGHPSPASQSPSASDSPGSAQSPR